MVVRAMVLGWLDGLFTSIHERVLYPSHRLGGEGNDILRGRKPPPPLFYSVANGFPRTLNIGSSVSGNAPSRQFVNRNNLPLNEVYSDRAKAFVLCSLF
jgi:hypothetical protein